MNKRGESIFLVVIITMITTAMLCFIGFKLWSYYQVADKGVDYVYNTVFGLGSVGSSVEASSGSSGIPATTQRKLEYLKNMIDNTYLYDYDEETMTDMMVTGMLVALQDPYAYYYNKEAAKAMYTEIEGEFFGIGVYVTYDKQKNMPVIVAPIDGSPALEAGIQTLDYIEYVDDLYAAEYSYTDLIDAIKGLPGTTVKIGVIRKNSQNEDEKIEFEVERRKIELTAVKSTVYNDSIGYIKLTSFDETTYDNFKKEYDRLMNGGVKSLIIDVRNNPGGIFDSCVKVTDLIVPEGKMIYTLDKKGKEEAVFSDKTKIEVPLVVLTNGSSASAAELFTAAIKDFGIGTIIGTKTYGKGVVQSLTSLGDGTMVKIKTSEYFSPKGNKINEKGIEPDIEIELPEELKNKYNLTFEEDVQLQKAIEFLESK